MHKNELNKPIELTEERTRELAQGIELAKFGIIHIDVEYEKVAHKEMCAKYSRYGSAAALIPNWSKEHGDLMNAQNQALGLLIQYIEKLQEVDSLKVVEANSNSKRDQLSKMFQ